MRVLFFGTYERDYPRNAQVAAALRRAGVEVAERHEPVWTGGEQWRAGARTVLRLLAAEVRLALGPRTDADAVLVGYPGHLDLAAARRVAGRAPVVFNPLVSLWDTLVEDRGRFRDGSTAARALRRLDRRALRAADLVVADTHANAEYMAGLAGLARVEVCFVGAEERLFMPAEVEREPATVLFVGKLIPLHGLETILAAARLTPDLRFRIVGDGQLRGLLDDRPANVEHVPWVAVRAAARRAAPRNLRARGLRHVGEGGPGDPEQGLSGDRLRNTARHGRYGGGTRAPGRRRERPARAARRRGGAGGGRHPRLRGRR